MNASLRYSPPFRERAISLVNRARPGHPSEWAAIQAVAHELGINAETLRGWVRQAEIDAGHRPGTTTAYQAELSRLRRENAALRRALDQAVQVNQPGPPHRPPPSHPVLRQPSHGGEYATSPPAADHTTPIGRRRQPPAPHSTGLTGPD
jgi:transposase